MGYIGLNQASGFSVNEKKSDMVITALDRHTDSPLESFVFQYFPEGITDSKPSNYQQKEIPGASLPIYQWVNGGERLISFSAVFASDVDYQAHGDIKSLETYNRVKDAGLERRNVDIRTALVHLRNFMLPSYGDASGPGAPLTFAPQKVRLLMPNSGIGLYGGFSGGAVVTPDSVVCFMTQCDFTFDAFFPSGLPRITTVQLAFAQSAQVGGRVQFPQSASGALASGDIYKSQNTYGFYSAGGFSTLPYALTPSNKFNK